MTSWGQDCYCDQRFECFCESKREVMVRGGKIETFGALSLYMSIDTLPSSSL